MSDSLMFVLPDGRSAEISSPSARLICDRLWELGITPGASLAATRITETLERHPMYWRDISFSQREVAPLLEAAQVAPPSWSLARHDPPLEQNHDARARLLASCETLIEALSDYDDQTKLRALTTDLEQLRDRLRTTN